MMERGDQIEVIGQMYSMQKVYVNMWYAEKENF